MELLIYITAFILGYLLGKQATNPDYIRDTVKAAQKKVKRVLKGNEAIVSDFETVAEKEYREQPLAIREEIDRVNSLGDDLYD